MLSVHIPRSMPELCALETQSCKTAVLRNAHSKVKKELDSKHQILQRLLDNYKQVKANWSVYPEPTISLIQLC